MRYALALLFPLLAGCATTAQSPGVIVLSQNLYVGACEWKWEATHRLHDPIVFACHGTSVAGVWMCFPDGELPLPMFAVARILKAAYPDRDIVLIVCNPSGATLNIEGVYYARKDIWTTPRRFRFANFNESSAVGRIEEFIAAP